MDTDHETTTTDEPTAAEVITPCPVCGATGVRVKLDDGTEYCPGHRGLAVATETTTIVADDPDDFNEAADVLAVREAITEGEHAEMAGDVPWPTLPPVRMVAGLIYEAALATFHEDGTYGDPPTGWAPPPADENPFMEAGAALAVAVLIEAAEIDRDVIKQLAETFCGRTNETESTSHE